MSLVHTPPLLPAGPRWLLFLGLRSRWPGAQFRSPEPLPSSEPREMKGRDPGRGSNAHPQGGALLAAGDPEAKMGAEAASRFSPHTGQETLPSIWAYAAPPERPGTHVAAQISRVSRRPRCPLLRRGSREPLRAQGAIGHRRAFAQPRGGRCWPEGGA